MLDHHSVLEKTTRCVHQIHPKHTRLQSSSFFLSQPVNDVWDAWEATGVRCVPVVSCVSFGAWERKRDCFAVYTPHTQKAESGFFSLLRHLAEKGFIFQYMR